jgi:hypothetical protein
MPRFMDYHDDLKLPQEAIDQIARETREGAADEFGVRQIELHHEALHGSCGDVH